MPGEKDMEKAWVDERTPRGVAGWAEPGFAEFADYRMRSGTSRETLEQYAEFLGTVRAKAPRPLLELTVKELQALDLALLKTAACYRTVLRMFYKAHKRHDLLDEMPRQRRRKEELPGLDETLMPADVDTLLEACTNKRDRALIAVLASTGSRIGETLSLKLGNVYAVNGSAFQVEFKKPKVKGQGRVSPKIEGPWGALLKEWLDAHPAHGNASAWLFPSSVDLGIHVNEKTVGTTLVGLARRAHVSKPVNPHAFRHARVTWGVIRDENAVKLCIAVWGKADTSMLSRYNHYVGLEMPLGEPTVRKLADVPALPTPPIVATQAQVGELADEVRRLRFGFQIMVSRYAAEKGIAPGSALAVHIDETTGEITIKPAPSPAESKDEGQT
jgi:integrase